MQVTQAAWYAALPPEARALLERATFGYLGIATGDDGYPVVVPVNFAILRGDVVVHGAPEGEKMRALDRDDRVTFTVVEPYSLIPSHFGDREDACVASQYFVSIVLKGRARLVETPGDKAEVLAALMEKLQPEGGYRPLDADDPVYAAAIAGTAAISIAVERATARVKLGQSLSPERREATISRLAARGLPLDLATVEAMRGGS